MVSNKDDTTQFGPAETVGPKTVSRGAFRRLEGSAIPLADRSTTDDPSAASSDVAGYLQMPEPGTAIGREGRFEILGKIGEGGMGYVFKALDRELSRYVAIKFLNPEGSIPSTNLLEVLLNEARAIAKLNHPNIVQIFDIGSFKGGAFLVMEYLCGDPLSRVLRQGPISVKETLRTADQLLCGLQHAHNHGVVHRDLKPSNVFRTVDGTVRILDFGIAILDRVAMRWIKRKAEGAETADGAERQIVGTPLYMSPEQWLGAEQDHRTDLWALGVILFEMLAGERATDDINARAIWSSVLYSELPTWVRSQRKSIPGALFPVITRALARDPADRFQSTSEFRDALSKAGERLLPSLPRPGDQQPSSDLVPDQRPLTVLACSLAMARSGASGVDFEEVSEILRTFQNTCAAEIRRFGGLVLSSAGDGLLGYFGYPTVKEGDPLRAVRAAAAIKEAVGGLPFCADGLMGTRIGVDTSLSVVEELEESNGRRVPVIQGAASQVAVLLRNRAEPGTILVSDRTNELVKGFFDTEGLPAERSEAFFGSVELKAYRLRGFIHIATRFDVSSHRALLPIVGRETELEQGEQLWRRAQAGEGQVYALAGEAGLGKSRLAHEFKQLVLGGGGTAFTVQCWPQFQNSAFHPLISLLRGSLGISRETPASEQLPHVEETLTTLGLSLAENVPVLATFLSTEISDDYDALDLEPEVVRRNFIELLTVIVFGMADRDPLLLIVEDLHWVDHSTLEFLTSLLPQVSDHRILVVLTYRPEFVPPWRADLTLTSTRVERLPPKFAERLVSQFASQQLVDDDLASETVSRLVERCNGVPLYLEELTALVMREASGGPLDKVPSANISRLPASLRELLGARLDRLSPTAKAIAQIGSVLGREFSVGRIIELLGSSHDLSADFNELVNEGVIVKSTDEQGQDFLFSHALFQEAAYQSIVPERRCAHHSQLADLLESDQRPDHKALPELLAYHHDRAGNFVRAIAFYEEAGNAAAQEWSLREAIAHFSRALELLQSLPADAARRRHELRLLMAIGPPLMSVHGYAAPDVAETYARAHELSLSEGKAALLFPALLGLWQHNLVAGNLAAARTEGTRLLELARSAEDSTLLLLARRSLGSTLFFQGEIKEAAEHTRAGWELYDIEKHGQLAFKYGNDPGVAHGVYLAWSLWLLGYPEQALQVVGKALGIARALDHPLSIAFATCYRGIVLNFCGDYGEAEALAIEALAVSKENHLELWQAVAQIVLGWALMNQDQSTEGVKLLTSGIDLWGKTGAGTGTTFYNVLLAEAHSRVGDLPRAAQRLQLAEEMVERNGEHFYEPELLRIKAVIAAQGGLGDADSPASYLRQGIDIAGQQTSRSWLLRLSCSLAALHLNTGAAADCAALLSETYAWFSEGQKTQDLRQAQQLLETLS